MSTFRVTATRHMDGKIITTTHDFQADTMQVARNVVAMTDTYFRTFHRDPVNERVVSIEPIGKVPVAGATRNGLSNRGDNAENFAGIRCDVCNWLIQHCDYRGTCSQAGSH